MRHQETESQATHNLTAVGATTSREGRRYGAPKVV